MDALKVHYAKLFIAALMVGAGIIGFTLCGIAGALGLFGIAPELEPLTVKAITITIPSIAMTVIGEQWEKQLSIKLKELKQGH